MEKYTNTRFYKKDNHDCANDGTCGQSITDFRIGNSDIFFYDSNGTAIAQIPKLPNGHSITYYNNLYKTAQSKNFRKGTKSVGLQDVLPNQFNFEHGKLNCVIHYDNVSQQEQEQMKLDIKNAYEAYKAKFCIASNIQVTVHTYIFNNRDDYRIYGTLVPGFSWKQSSLNTSGGMTNGKSVLLYKNGYTDNVLAHEFGHVFQFKLSEAKVRKLDFVNGQLMANAIGLEVEEKNYKAICKKMDVDKYEDRGSMFTFKYKGTTYNVRYKDFSEDEKFQFIKDIKNSHESLVSQCDGLGDENTVLSIYVDENKEISRIYFQNYNKKIDKRLDKTLISRSKPEEEVNENRTNPEPEEEQKGDDYIDKRLDKTLISRSKPEEEVNENRTNPEPEEEQKGDDYIEFTGVLQFKYKGINYNIQHNDYLSAEKEKLQFIKDIKNSHESLVSECDGLNEGSLSQNATLVIFVDKNKNIEKMCFHNPDKNIYEWLDKTLISRSKPEQDVDDTDPKPGKEPEPESAKEDTQQPSNFLSSIIVPTIKSIIGSVSSLFSWLFGSKEKEQSDNNSSLLELNVDHDADENYVGNHSLCNHDYHQHDELM